jgi:hypothetical protein
MTARKKTRKNAGEGYGMMFHGAFGSKADAKRKEREVHGFIQPRNIKGERRYVVMSERKNPIKRKKNPSKIQVFFDNAIKKFTAATSHPKHGNIYASGFTKKEAAKNLKDRMREIRKTGSVPSDRGYAANPHELLIMGANPHGAETQQEISLPPGSTILIRTPRQNPVHIRRQNPDAAGIREDFTGMPVEHEHVREEPHMPAGNYAQLGNLLSLYVKPRKGSQVLEIKPSRVIVVSDESARQIWFVGGDQDVSEALEQFGALNRGTGIYELGEARRIDYEQRKEHVPHPDQDHWRHNFGEETDERPTVLFDLPHKRLLLEGGAYQIRREGIVN